MIVNSSNVPEHLGIILDGNRRWAKEHGKTSLEGHKAGYETLKKVTEAAFNKGIKYVSAYVFSTENWNRQKEEVSYLMDMALMVLSKDIKELHKKGVRLLWLGSSERLSPKHIKAIRKAVELTKNNTKGTLCLCFNYGGTQEITDAVKKLLTSETRPGDVNPEMLRKYLYEPEVPDVDMVVRTSGEERISNFMLWRVAYAELYFMNKHWPDFDGEDVDNIIKEYSKRQRRFGA